VDSNNLKNGSADVSEKRLSEEARSSGTPSFVEKIIAEVAGTFVLILVGCGAVSNTKYTASLMGLGQTATLWGFAVYLAAFTCGNISGGHFNPAVTLAFAMVRPKEFSRSLVIPYFIAQVTGTFLAGSVNYYFYSYPIAEFELSNGFVRNESGHSFSGAFGCYWSDFVVDSTHALMIEVIATAMLTFIIFSLTNKANNLPEGGLVTLLVGGGVYAIIALTGSLSGAGINPARDLGGRLFTFFAGWGSYGFEGAWVYSVGPFFGGLLGASIADGILYRQVRI